MKKKKTSPKLVAIEGVPVDQDAQAVAMNDIAAETATEEQTPPTDSDTVEETPVATPTPKPAPKEDKEPKGIAIAPIGTVNGRSGKTQLAGNLNEDEDFGEAGTYEMWEYGNNGDKVRMIARPTGCTVPVFEVGATQRFAGAKNGRFLFEATLTAIHTGSEGLKAMAAEEGASVRSYRYA